MFITKNVKICHCEEPPKGGDVAISRYNVSYLYYVG